MVTTSVTNFKYSFAKKNLFQVAFYIYAELVKKYPKLATLLSEKTVRNVFRLISFSRHIDFMYLI